mmetsp:Transcript_32314/g.32617  ORF Transcript_32314/g.32617 Transcript_32314/m.32617 type:complete len:180 (-) Transcript_32314:91-630(-)
MFSDVRPEFPGGGVASVNGRERGVRSSPHRRWIETIVRVPCVCVAVLQRVRDIEYTSTLEESQKVQSTERERVRRCVFVCNVIFFGGGYEMINFPETRSRFCWVYRRSIIMVLRVRKTHSGVMASCGVDDVLSLAASRISQTLTQQSSPPVTNDDPHTLYLMACMVAPPLLLPLVWVWV